MDDLPNHFDVIVVGTGMPECIVAAAVARAGKTVLHLDRNGYYGGDWASFNFDQILDWIDAHKDLDSDNHSLEHTVDPSWTEQLSEGEQLVLCPKNPKSNHNIVQKTYVREKHISETNICADSAISEGAGDISSDCDTTHREVSSDLGGGEASQIQPSATVRKSDTSCQQELAVATSNVAEQVITESSIPTFQIDAPDTIDSTQSAASEENEPSCETSEQENASEDTQNSAIPDPAPSSTSSTDSSQTSSQNEWTLEMLREHRRKFNIDLSPKLLFARGSLVELLISSNISRYAEFQCVSRVLTVIDDHLVQVPCSRADVFSTKNVSVVEKRMLMKLLTFCMEYEKHPEEYRRFEGKLFIDFLRSRKVTPQIEHYVLHAIAMVDESCPTLQGLKAAQKFMESLGRYGNSPFLWTCYGSAELPQCFCRLCAVFGGIYYLKRDIDAVILDSEQKFVGVISRGKKITCQSLVMEYSYAPLEYLPEQSPDLISRAVYITDSSIMPSERQQTTLLRLPPIPGLRNATTVLEFGSNAYTCPRNLYLVHMICRAYSKDVETDFKASETLLFKPVNEEEKSDEQDSKPKILWCMYFRQNDTTGLDLNDRVPTSVFLTSSPGGEQDYEHAVKEAQEIFEKICHGEEFLPRAPDPEDIVLEEHSNPGENHEIDKCCEVTDNTDLNSTLEGIKNIEVKDKEECTVNRTEDSEKIENDVSDEDKQAKGAESEAGKENIEGKKE